MTAFLPPSADIDVDSQLYDNVYQSASNQLVSATRVLTGQCAKFPLQTNQLGGQTIIDLSGDKLLGHTTLNLVFTYKALKDTKATLGQAWGYDALDWVEYQFANSERLRIEGRQMFIKNLADCESGEKKQAVITYGGESYNGVAKTDGELANGRLEAYISLYLPFSNLSASRILPFDSTILSRPVQIVLQFKNPEQLFTATSGEIANGAIIYPTAFSEAYVMCKTMIMVDGPSDSIRSQVSLGGGQKYTYGYIYPLAFQSADIHTGVARSGPGKVSVKLERFLNGSLQSIDIFLERLTTGDVTNSPYRRTSHYNPLAKFVQIENAQLIFSGQCIWRSDDKSDRLMNLSEYPTTTGYSIQDWAYGTAAAPGGEVGGTGSWLHIQLSQLNERVFTNLTETGVVLVSNQVLLEFNTPELFDLQNPVPVQQPLYRVHAVYNYQAGVRVADGSTHLVFQPPQQALPAIAGALGVL